MPSKNSKRRLSVPDAHQHVLNVRTIRVGKVLRKHIGCACGHTAREGTQEHTDALAGLAETERLRSLRFGVETSTQQGRMEFDG